MLPTEKYYKDYFNNKKVKNILEFMIFSLE